MRSKFEIIKSAVFGFAVGDALGVPVEFCSREEMEENPVNSMRGFGTYPYPAGTWSDDTSMTLACMDSLLNGIDLNDMMIRFCDWFENAKYTPYDEVFDIGASTRKSLLLYLVNEIPANECGQRSEWDNGNGSLMRIIPAALFLCCANSISVSEKIEYIHNISALTHAHMRSQMACGIYAFVVWELFKENSKEAVYRGILKARDFYKENEESKHYSRIFESNIAEFSRNDIKGSGYVVDCLEAALWCLLNSDNYKDCVLTAVNLGEDTDTTAAVAGGIAGILYGYEDIPDEWLETIKRKEYIEELCQSAAKGWKY